MGYKITSDLSVCQVYTPKNVVTEMLDLLQYKDNVYGKKILENSVGTGNILEQIVERYISSCLKNRMTPEMISTGLGRDIIGYEIESSKITECINRLNGILLKYGIEENVKWNIYNEDALKSTITDFDYIIGNPPYISYKDLENDTRRFIKNFSGSFNGKPDYYYAFIEKSLMQLKNGGSMVYLFPNNVFKNKFASKIRDIMKPYIVEIRDYRETKLFIDRITSSAIVKFIKEPSNEFIYIDKLENLSRKLIKDTLDKKWIFDSIETQYKNSFGEYFKARVSVATQSNEIFLVNKKEKIYEKDGFLLDSKSIRPAASPKSLSKRKNEFIIYPYINNTKSYEKILNFHELYPNTYNYLLTKRDILDKRKSDKTATFYEYGRSQGLLHLNQEKLIISTIVTNKIKIYLVDKNVIPYSGIFITSNGQYPLDVAIKILKSDNFLNYVKKVGINASGNSYRITADDINNYRININDFI